MYTFFMVVVAIIGVVALIIGPIVASLGILYIGATIKDVCCWCKRRAKEV